MTTTIFEDIATLEDCIINLTEGASDEKRMAIMTLERMAARMKKDVAEFEDHLERLYQEDSDGIGEGQMVA